MSYSVLITEEIAENIDTVKAMCVIMCFSYDQALGTWADSLTNEIACLYGLPLREKQYLPS